MVDHLTYVAKSEGITAEPSALNIIARKADGAMRDALSIFDQVAASSRGNITYRSTIDNLNVLDFNYYNRLLDCFLEGKVLDSWLIYKEIRDKELPTTCVTSWWHATHRQSYCSKLTTTHAKPWQRKP